MMALAGSERDLAGLSAAFIWPLSGFNVFYCCLRALLSISVYSVSSGSVLQPPNEFRELRLPFVRAILINIDKHAPVIKSFFFLATFSAMCGLIGPFALPILRVSVATIEAAARQDM